MNSVLIASDEEVDAGPYMRYLRSLSDTDLLDITRHTDPDAYPARCDMVAREVRRRGVVAQALYTPAEFAVRCLSVTGICLCVLPLSLAFLLDPETARGADWPDAATLSDGTNAARIMTLLLIGTLRVMLAICVRTGVFPVLTGILTGWLAAHLRAMRVSRPARDVGQLAFVSLSCLLITVCVTGHSAVPLVFGAAQDTPGWLIPWGLAL